MGSRKLSLIPLFAALTAAGAFIRLPMVPVPVTLQTLFVVMSGMVLGHKAGALSQAIYIIIGLMGLPVFSGGGGPAYVVSPTFGYLLGFVGASALSGYLMRGRNYSFRNVLGVSIAGLLSVYAIGMPYLAWYLHFILGKPEALGFAVKTGFLVFLPGDAVKCAILVMVMPRLGRIIERLPGSRS